MWNEFSGNAYGPVVQAGRIDRLEVRHQPPVTHLRQLPPAIPLIGRSAELTELRSLADAAPAALAVTGLPWAGKSALALAFAHELAERYPDGQLYLDFSGDNPVSREGSLRWVLRSLGLAEASLPDELTHLVSAYRSALAERRVLVLLDNLADDTTVELFTTKAGLVLATRRGVPLLSQGVAKLHLKPLGLEDAAALLRHEAGTDIHWSRDDADRLARICGGLPLVLVAVAHHLRGTAYSPSGLGNLLANGGVLPSALSVNGKSLRDSMAVSYRRLPKAARSAFRRLGSCPGETVSDTALEAVTGGADVDACAVIRSALVAEGLLVEHWRGGTTELPMPFQLVAKEFLAEDEGESAPEQILDQVLDYYVDESQSALSAWLGTHPPGTGEGLSDMVRRGGRGFFLGESHNLRRLLEHAATHRLDATVGLAGPLLEYMVHQNPNCDLKDVHDTILRAVREFTTTYQSEFEFLLRLSQMYTRLSQSTEAADCLLVAQRVARDANDDQRATEAARLLHTALEIHLAFARDSGDRDWVAGILVLLANTHRDLDSPRSARPLLLEALAHYRTTEKVRDAADVLTDLGDVSRDLGQLRESTQFLEESVRLFEQTEDRQGLGLALDSLADTLTSLGSHAEAAIALERADALLAAEE